MEINGRILSLIILCFFATGCRSSRPDTPPKYSQDFLSNYIADGYTQSLVMLVPCSDSSFVFVNHDDLYTDYSIRYRERYLSFMEFLYDIMNKPGSIRVWKASEPVVFHIDPRMQDEMEQDFFSFLTHYTRSQDRQFEKKDQYKRVYAVRYDYRDIEPAILKMCFDSGLYIHSYVDYSSGHGERETEIANYYCFNHYFWEIEGEDPSSAICDDIIHYSTLYLKREGE